MHTIIYKTTTKTVGWRNDSHIWSVRAYVQKKKLCLTYRATIQSKAKMILEMALQTLSIFRLGY